MSACTGCDELSGDPFVEFCGLGHRIKHTKKTIFLADRNGDEIPCSDFFDAH